MTTQTEALKLALEALEVAEHFVEEYAASKYYFAHVAAIAAIKEALAQPEQEPVAYFNPQVKGGFYWARPTKITAPVTVSVEPMPLYTTPPQRKPLTDEQIRSMEHEYIRRRDFARAIEAAHGIKGDT